MVAGVTPLLVHNCGPVTRDDAIRAHDRAQELQSIRDDFPGANYNGVTAVIGVFNSSTKKVSIRIGISGGAELPPAWTLRGGEEFIQAAGHAEEGIIKNLGKNEHIIFGAATSNFCKEHCLPLVNVRGMTLEGGHGTKKYSPFRYFWLAGD